ncbi:transcriptional regulator of RNA polII, SAGA, subunit-domain-containing protein [Lipomyces arxii]|uniref:transcriptional regulator of RNA polII, SAGA, subunit-domain-containing protein n=1 Tax=Lipomyces arxii TaxID=56418 RepID=UPI0034CF4ECD
MFAQAAARTSSSVSSHMGVNGAASARSSPQPLKKSYSSSSIQGVASSNTSLANGAASTNTTNNNTPTRPQKPARRIEVEPLMNDLRRALGDHWEHYREVITDFLTGRLTRNELEQELSQILDKGMIRMHNQFLLASLANALRDPPPSLSGLPAWNTRSKNAPSRVSNMGDPVVARLKSEIMGFTPRERRRLKAVTKDAGKKGPMPSSIVLTRHAKIPQVLNAKEREKIKGNTVQDITQSYHAPLATESFELPDADNLRTRVLGIAYEHGLVDGISNEVPEFILAGLEYHLRDFLQQLLNRVRPQKHKKSLDAAYLSMTSSVTQPLKQEGDPTATAASSNTDVKQKPGVAVITANGTSSAGKRKRQLYEDDGVITAEDMALALDLAPHSIIELSGPLYRLWDVMLKDEIDDFTSPIS